MSKQIRRRLRELLAGDLRRARVAICVVGFLSLAVAAGAAGQGDAPSSKVLVASTEASAEITQAIPITPHGRGEVVSSLRPDDLPGLRTGDQLEVSAEVEVTTDCLLRHHMIKSECRGKAYRFNPRIGASLILTDRAGAREGFPLSEHTQIVCRQKLPAREHHCYIALTPDPVIIDELTLPCVTGTCRVNLVMDASHPRARRGNVVLLGGNRGPEKVKQDKASIDAVRIRPADPGQVPPAPPNGTTIESTSERVVTGLSLDHPPRTAVVYSQRLENVDQDDQIAARGLLITGIRQLRHNANISTRIVLTDAPLSTIPLLGEGEMAKEGGEITENNGFNCTQRTTPCETIKAGVLRLQEGAEGPLYVNLVLSVGRVGGRAPGDNIVTVQEGGFLRVVHYPAEHKE
jgi:hypothetical protein